MRRQSKSNRFAFLFLAGLAACEAKDEERAWDDSRANVYVDVLADVAKTSQLLNVGRMRSQLPRLLVIASRTVAPPKRPWWEFREKLSTLRRDTYNDFWKTNAEAMDLKLQRVESIPVRLVSEQELDHLLDPRTPSETLDDGWHRFRSEYPEVPGIIGLSAIGFSPDRKQALVFFSLVSGSVSGAGFYLLLEYSDENWKVARDWRVWVS